MRPMTRAGYNFSLVQTPAMDNMVRATWCSPRARAFLQAATTTTDLCHAQAAEGVTFDFAYVQYSYCS